MNLSNEIYHIGTFAYGENLSANTEKRKGWTSKESKK